MFVPVLGKKAFNLESVLFLRQLLFQFNKKGILVIVDAVDSLNRKNSIFLWTSPVVFQ